MTAYLKPKSATIHCVSWNEITMQVQNPPEEEPASSEIATPASKPVGVAVGILFGLHVVAAIGSRLVCPHEDYWSAIPFAFIISQAILTVIWCNTAKRKLLVNMAGFFGIAILSGIFSTIAFFEIPFFDPKFIFEALVFPNLQLLAFFAVFWLIQTGCFRIQRGSESDVFRRPPFQFSLWQLITLTTLVAVTTAVLTAIYHSLYWLPYSIDLASILVSATSVSSLIITALLTTWAVLGRHRVLGRCVAAFLVALGVDLIFGYANTCFRNRQYSFETCLHTIFQKSLTMVLLTSSLLVLRYYGYRAVRLGASGDASS